MAELQTEFVNDGNDGNMGNQGGNDGNVVNRGGNAGNQDGNDGNVLNRFPLVGDQEVKHQEAQHIWALRISYFSLESVIFY